MAAIKDQKPSACENVLLNVRSIHCRQRLTTEERLVILNTFPTGDLIQREDFKIQLEKNNNLKMVFDQVGISNLEVHLIIRFILLSELAFQRLIMQTISSLTST